MIRSHSKQKTLRNTRWFLLLTLLLLELIVLGRLLRHDRQPAFPDKEITPAYATATLSPPTPLLTPAADLETDQTLHTVRISRSQGNTTSTTEPTDPPGSKKELRLDPPPREPLPEGFVRAEDVIPDLVIDLKYLGYDNFIGRPIAGYESNSAIMTAAAAQALKRVQTSLYESGHGLILYDAYRPKTAVSDFVNWAQDQEDQLMKASYYPDINKTDILKDGYIATRSGHSRGSTVDVSLIRLDTGDMLDMGASFDFFGKESHPDWTGATIEQATNRALLRTTMEGEGFVISSIEWWHFRLKNEPFPDKWFDFPVR